MCYFNKDCFYHLFARPEKPCKGELKEVVVINNHYRQKMFAKVKICETHYPLAYQPTKQKNV